MNCKVILLTGNELRHEFFRKFIASDNQIRVLSTFCESEKGNISQVIENETNHSLRLQHLSAWTITEIDFFGLYCDSIIDYSNPIFIEKGQINDSKQVDLISSLNPDIIISYGCSIIKSELLNLFEGRFLNIHLGRKQIIKCLSELKRMPTINFDRNEERYYKKKDFTENAIRIACNNI